MGNGIHRRAEIGGYGNAIAGFGLLACLLGCAPQAEEGVVARVFGQDITAEEYARFFEKLPESLRSSRDDIDGHVENLQSLIDKQLLLREARERGLHQDREFLRKTAWKRDQRILGVLHQKIRGEIEIEIDEDELRTFCTDTGRDREVKLSFLAYDTAAEARSARERIRDGVDFVELAARQSAEEGPLFRGYDPDLWFLRDAILPALRESAASMEVGQVSEPIPFRGRHVLLRIPETRAADFEQYRNLLRGKLIERKFEERQEAMLQDLRARFSLTMNEEGMRRFIREAANAVSSAYIDSGIPLYAYEGGAVTSGDLTRLMANTRAREADLFDSSAVAEFAREKLVPHVLFLREAQSLGLDAEPRAALERKMDGLLVEALLRREVKGGPQASFDEAKKVFDENPDLFSGSEYTEVQEILVETEEEANELLERLWRDAMDVDVDALADEHTVRPVGKGHGGRFHFHQLAAPLYGGLVEAAAEAPLHELQGPVRLEGGYSLFWVLSRSRVRYTFEDKRVQFVARNIATKARENERFDALVDHLRSKYGDDVQIFRRSLRQVAAGLDA